MGILLRSAHARVRELVEAHDHHRQPLKNAAWPCAAQIILPISGSRSGPSPSTDRLNDANTDANTCTTNAETIKGSKLGMISPNMIPRLPTPESLATETNWRSFIVSTCARITSVGPIQAKSKTINAIV